MYSFKCLQCCGSLLQQNTRKQNTRKDQSLLLLPDALLPSCQEFGKHGDEWHRLYAGYPSGTYKVNAVEMKEPLAPYELLCGLLVPLYVPRVTEEVLHGRRGVTLQTSREVLAPLS